MYGNCGTRAIEVEAACSRTASLRCCSAVAVTPCACKQLEVERSSRVGEHLILFRWIQGGAPRRGARLNHVKKLLLKLPASLGSPGGDEASSLPFLSRKGLRRGLG